ncbi:hypothetical protein PENSPDRAFT_750423 [Peniophora sp. CONT]|nr:hypothetical protein PENSPDRAFT_750423 [Peniophora sp. CONT]
MPMPHPARIVYEYKQTSVMADTPATRAQALEAAHREFAELRNVKDQRIHFSMCRKLHANYKKNSRISPTIWETFFRTLTHDPDHGLLIIFIEVDPPTWADRLGLAKEKKRATLKEGPGQENEVGAGLPAYSKGSD